MKKQTSVQKKSNLKGLVIGKWIFKKSNNKNVIVANGGCAGKKKREMAKWFAWSEFDGSRFCIE